MDRIIFISHSTKDKKLAYSLVELLCSMGIKPYNIFCSSQPTQGVPIQSNYKDYLANVLCNKETIAIFLLSENYYEGVICLNEMGAIWAHNLTYYTILAPGFTVDQIKGVIDPDRIAISLDENTFSIEKKLDELKIALCQTFQCKPTEWVEHRELFMQRIKEYGNRRIVQDLKHFLNICVNESTSAGCLSTYDNDSGILHTQIDFSATNTNDCLVVFTPEVFDVQHWIKRNGSIRIRIKSNDFVAIFLELRIIDGYIDKTLQKAIPLTPNWNDCVIPITSFAGPFNGWQRVQEIKFLVKRGDVTSGTFDISALEIHC